VSSQPQGEVQSELFKLLRENAQDCPTSTQLSHTPHTSSYIDDLNACKRGICMGQQNRVSINRDYALCSGCRRCEIACSLLHEKRIWSEASRVRVFMFVPGIEIPHLCFQCDRPKCVDACPESALSVDEQTGAINVDAQICTACGLCIDACPGRVPHLHPDGSHVLICDLCGGDPECAKTCQQGKWNALTLSKRDDDSSTRQQPATPQELTRRTGTLILGERTLREVWDQ